MSPSLVEPFLASVAIALRPAFAAMIDLDERLRALWSDGSAQWPNVSVEPGQYMSFVASRLPPDRRADEALAAVRAGDLYLTCACAGGSEVALAAFDRRFMGEIDFALARMRTSPQEVDEIKQLVRQKLFVGDGNRPGRIADYSGRGDLRRWVRSIAVRTFLNQRRRNGREVLQRDDQILMDERSLDDDPELAYMKERYRNEFRIAFLDALRGLTDREQNLLRYHHVDGLNIDEIGAIYRVHRVTAYRWLEKARESLVERTHRALKAQLQVEKREFDSILRLIRSQLQLSIVRHLGGGPEAAPGSSGDDDEPAEPGEPVP